MGALKLTACMKVVAKMGEMDQDALLERLDRYSADGVPKERAQIMAASDTLAELEAERKQFMGLLRTQHPDLFVVRAPEVKRSAGRSEDDIATARAEGWTIADNDLPSREAAERIVKLRTKGNSVVKPMAAWQDAEVRIVESDNPGMWAIETRSADIKLSPVRDVTETPEFKAWFGDSKVVDSDGKPLVVYTGTSKDVDFKSFKIPKNGAWFTSDPYTASAYALENDSMDIKTKDYRTFTKVNTASRVMPAYLRIEKLYTPTTDEMTAMIRASNYKREQGNLFDRVRREGFDGVDMGNGVYVVIGKPTQIKSAIGNNGEFDPSNPDIRRSTKRSPLGFYSALAKGIEDLPTKQAPAGAWKAAIKGLVNKGAAKQDEVTWSGIEDWLDLQEGKVGKEQIAEYLAANGVQVNEVTLRGSGLTGPQVDAQLDQWAENNPGPVASAIERGEPWGDIRPIAMREGAQEVVAILDSHKDNDDAKYKSYTLPGGENYREVLLTLPVADELPPIEQMERRVEVLRELQADYKSEGMDELAAKTEAKIAKVEDAIRKSKTQKQQGTYKSSHWDQKNVLAHIRVNDRSTQEIGYVARNFKSGFVSQVFATPDEAFAYQASLPESVKTEVVEYPRTVRVLFVEEIQSDWGQDGKKQGFDTKPVKVVQKNGLWGTEYQGDFVASISEERAHEDAAQLNIVKGGSIPVAPFVTKTEGWLNLALKRVMIMAAEGGYDKVAFVNGEQSADRYDLSKQIQSISYSPQEKLLDAWDNNRRKVMRREITDESQLEEYIGKEVAKRLLAQPLVMGKHLLDGEDIKVGGEGMKTFYDSIVPNAVKKLLPKVGGDKLQMVNVQQTEGFAGNSRKAPAKAIQSEQPGFDVTPAMRDKARQGLTLFSRRREVNEASGVYKVDIDGNPVPKKKSAGIEVPEGEYATGTAMVTTRRQKIGAKTIKTDGDVAAALSYLSRGAVERFDAIVTDKKDKPLAIIGGFKGALSQASVYPSTLIGEAIQIPGAANIWFAHNHPSGVSALSAADRSLYETLADVFNNSGIKPRSLLAVTPDTWNSTGPDGDDRGRTNPMPDGATVNVQEREIIRSGQIGDSITSPWQAREVASRIAARNGNRSGLLLLNAQNAPVAYVPWEAKNSEFLKREGRLPGLYRAISEANAGAAIVVDPASEFSPISWRNISKALKQSDVRLLDVLQGGASVAEVGANLEPASVLMSPRRQEETPEFKRWFGDSKVVDANGEPLVMYHGTYSDVGQFTTNFGDDEYRRFGAHVGSLEAAQNRLGVKAAEDTVNRERGGNAGANVMPVYVRAENSLRLDENRSGRWGIDDIMQSIMDKADQGEIDALSSEDVDDYMNDSFAIEEWLDLQPAPGDANYDPDQQARVWSDQAEFQPGERSKMLKEFMKRLGYDSIVYSNEFELGGDSYIIIDPTQIKSAIGNNGDFDPGNMDIRRSTGRTSTGAAWDSPSVEKFDDLVYKLQDKQIDIKRVVDAIKTASGAIADDLNVYLQEELYHGRTAKRTEDFVNMELNPLVEQMAKDGLSMEDLEEYLHARHAEEANKVIAARNPGAAGLQDGGSGMMTADAKQYLATLPADMQRKLSAAAAKVDAILGKTRQLYVDYELESKDTVAAWGKMFQHYIPLQREDKDGSPGIGQGFSVKGRETKGRTGSTRKVVDILANIALQREKAIVRGEKNRVSQALVGLADSNPNDGFWKVDIVPTERVFNEKTGLVEDRVDPLYKSRENALIAKIADASGRVREHAVLFNEEDERAMRMAAALKNLDASKLEGLMGVSASISRYFAAVNTQYNPVFGVVNLVRDVQGAILNLGTTPIADDRSKVAKYTLSALRGIYGDARAARKGQSPSSQWAALWDEFQEVGGQTGYRDLFRTSADRADAIKKVLDPDAWADSRLGKIFTVNGTLKVPMAAARRVAGWIFDWLSDYNLAMENGVRLAAYKAALERGLSKEQAASVAKNLTVNFNRKGQIGQQAGALYAFFNASVQGTARIGQTLFDMEPGKPKTLRLSSFGKKIVGGGVMLGSIQAMMLAAAGYNDEDPPEFVRERSLIIPLPGGKYMTIPMPLGFHVIPNIGRHATEFALSGFKDPHKRAVTMAAMFADTFNPIGNAGLSMQTLAPTALDPLVALTENRDYTGKPIARESSNKATPGHALSRDTATSLAKFMSEGINTLSGGNKYVAGVFSPTPDQIDYLIGQVTGGVGRELSKVEQTGLSLARGEDLPTYKVPLAGRFFGDTKQQASEGSEFYANTERLNRLETEIKGLQKDGKTAEAAELRRSSSEAYLITQANVAERQIQRLRNQKRELVKDGAPREQVRAIEEQITQVMARLNRAVESLREKQEN